MNIPLMLMYITITNYTLGTEDLALKLEQSLKSDTLTVPAQDLVEGAAAPDESEILYNSEELDAPEEELIESESYDKEVFSDNAEPEILEPISDIAENEELSIEEIEAAEILEIAEPIEEAVPIIETEHKVLENKDSKEDIVTTSEIAASEDTNIPEDLDSLATSAHIIATEEPEEKTEALNKQTDQEIKIAEKPDEETQQLISEALEEDNKKDPEQEIVHIKQEKEKTAEIKEESDLFELDKDEFLIEELAIKDKGETIEISTEKPKDSLSEKREINSKEEINETEEKIALIKTEQEKIKEQNEEEEITLEEIVVELTEEEKLAAKIKKLLVIRKPHLTYKTQINPPIINQRVYDIENEHLDNIAFEEEYYQMLFAAIDGKHLNAIEALTRRKGVNNDISVNGQPPVVYAVNQGDINVLRKLLALDYSPNAKDEAGNAPIHLAVMYNRPDILTELINYGADLTITNAIFKRPMNLAYEIGNQYLVDILYKAGAYNVRAHKKFHQFIQTN